MATLLEFPKPERIPDIEFEGSGGPYSVYARSDAGVRFLVTNVVCEPWQGTPRPRIIVENPRFAQEIAQEALNKGCLVRLNGKEL